jgi:hypothetical protein
MVRYWYGMRGFCDSDNVHMGDGYSYWDALAMYDWMLYPFTSPTFPVIAVVSNSSIRQSTATTINTCTGHSLPNKVLRSCNSHHNFHLTTSSVQQLQFCPVSQDLKAISCK